MRSRVADEIRRDQQRRVDAMTPDERVAAALALGERAITDYMQNFGVDRREAVRVLRRAGQAGRRYSACMDDGPDRRDR